MDTPEWQQALRDAVREPRRLLESAGLETGALALAQAGLEQFPVRAPRAFLGRIRPGDPADPLLRQVFPLAEEDLAVPGYGPDPVGEIQRHAAPGLIRKYRGRALLVVTGACAVHCRYCFRRHYPYEDHPAARDHWDGALSAIRSDGSLREIILSGGDPLTLSDARLGGLIARLAEIPHLAWLRVHTRMPVVLPSRITPALADILSGNRLRQAVVIHCNHPAEIDAEVQAALEILHDRGIQLLNQSVLLRGVNDDAAVLAQLSERLYACRVLPYYLHLLDPVAGAAHFEVDETAARSLMQQLRAALPGYLVPRLVREIPGEPGKTPVA